MWWTLVLVLHERILRPCLYQVLQWREECAVAMWPWRVTVELLERTVVRSSVRPLIPSVWVRVVVVAVPAGVATVVDCFIGICATAAVPTAPIVAKAAAARMFGKTDYGPSRAERPSMSAPEKLRTSGGRSGLEMRSSSMVTAASVILRTGWRIVVKW